MVSHESNIISTENNNTLSANDISEIIEELKEIRLSVNRIEARLAASLVPVSTAHAVRKVHSVVEGIDRQISSTLPSKTESHWGFTEGDRVKIKNIVEIGGFRVLQKDRQGYVTGFTRRFIRISIKYEQSNQIFEKTVCREPQNVEHI